MKRHNVVRPPQRVRQALSEYSGRVSLVRGARPALLRTSAPALNDAAFPANYFTAAPMFARHPKIEVSRRAIRLAVFDQNTSKIPALTMKFNCLIQPFSPSTIVNAWADRFVRLVQIIANEARGLSFNG